MQPQNRRRSELNERSRTDRNRRAGCQPRGDRVRAADVGSNLIARFEPHLIADGSPAAIQLRSQQHDALPVSDLADPAVFAQRLLPFELPLFHLDILCNEPDFGDWRSLAFRQTSRPGSDAAQLTGSLIDEGLKHEIPAGDSRRDPVQLTLRAVVFHSADRFRFAQDR